jgi:hypothetical protein
MRPPVAQNEAPYSERLQAAMARAGKRSGRWLATRIAEERGIDAENARRDVRDYLAGRAEPKAERAELIAVILGAPELGVVRSMAERQAARRSELEARVADLEQLLNKLLPRIDQLADRVDALSKPARPKRASTGKRHR